MARALLAAASIIESGELDALRDDRYAGWDDAPTARAAGGQPQPRRPLQASARCRRAGSRRRAARSSSRTSSPATSSAPAEPVMALVVGVDSSTQSTKVEARDLDTGAGRRHRDAPSTRRPRRRSPNRTRDAWWTRSCAGDGTARRPPRARSWRSRSPASSTGWCCSTPTARRCGRQALERHDLGAAGRAVGASSSGTAAVGGARPAACPVASFTITKLAWVAEHEPDVFGAWRRVMLPHDYLTWRLCGAHVTDRGDASGTGWFDPCRGDYSPAAARPRRRSAAVAAASCRGARRDRGRRAR